jgi:serine protease Do
MKKIKYYVIYLIIFIALLSMSGCVLPGLEFNTQPSSTQVPSPTQTPPPINPSFSAPPLSTSIPPAAAGLPDFITVIAKARPSVVAINTKVPALSLFGGEFTQEGAGSGWILDSSGLIVTNNHVVEGANSISVTLEDGRNFSADMVRTDPVSDLAVLKINAPNLPPALEVGDSSKLRVGEWVVAIGNSLGQGISATKGIVSALGVSVSTDTSETLYDLIQTDAAINPGNSGGPLVNIAGEVIGINSIKVAQVGVEGMGYAISSHLSMPIINELVTSGYVTRPWLGVGLYTVNETVVLRYRLAVDKGILITQVVAGAPADQAGIKTGDVISMIDGKSVATVDELVRTVRSHQVGETIKVNYWRGSNQTTTNIKLAQAPTSP